jgi:D-alanyl-D-alanine carboxypeptidase/D-alanyl-D-alanine-endopeptidase (penicillin-binding protein 4)
LPDDASGPVVSSLADLAADGDAEALRRLVELAGAPWPEARLGAGLGDALVGVADAAPDELVEALRVAPAEASGATAGRLSEAMGRSEEKEHPFPAALRALAEKDGPGAEYARTLLSGLRLSPPPPQPARIGPAPAPVENDRAKGKK